ncbi:MAG TPA: methyl-accepting chemotaxis protein [Candidatus Binatia bacterium]|nr:methyl-accepting chemotaxis protein [Candidatus Binatia bacterium]
MGGRVTLSRKGRRRGLTGIESALARAQRGFQTASRRLFVRLVAGTLLIAVAVMSLVVVVLTNNSSSALVGATTAHLEDLARSAASRLEAWVQLGGSQLAEWAEGLSTAGASQGDLSSLLQRSFSQTESIFSEVDLVDDHGALLASTAVSGAASYPGPAALSSGGLGATFLPVERVGSTLRWYAFVPVGMAAYNVVGYLVGNIDIGPELSQVFDAVIASTSSPIVVEAVAANHELVFSSTMASSTLAMMAEGSLSEDVRSPAVDAALKTGSLPGALSYGQGAATVFVGYAHDFSLDWAITATEPASVALAPVSSGQAFATWMLICGVGLLAIATSLISLWVTRPIGRLAAAARSIAAGNLSMRVRPSGAMEVAALGDSFNAMVASLATLIIRVRKASVELGESATRLSASSAQLAGTTIHQSTATAETSASMTELARTSAQIAASIESVAERAELTQEALAQAQDDIRRTSQRSVELSHRVRQVSDTLAIIGDIAEATNLLAFNASIEAARAGAAGRGFNVIADEVRRLADRTKRLAAEVAEITRGAQSETAATVMAMEKGVTQLDSGLQMMVEVAEASSQVRLATVEQRTASEHVVEAMEQVSAASRQLTATSQEIAGTASNHATMAKDLQEAAAVSGRAS